MTSERYINSFRAQPKPRGVRQSARLRLPSSAARSFSSDEPAAAGAPSIRAGCGMSKAKLAVKIQNRDVNLQAEVARAVSHGAVKDVARALNCTPRNVAELRTELRLPRVPLFLEIARQDPKLRALVLAILCGPVEADPAKLIDTVMRRIS